MRVSVLLLACALGHLGCSPPCPSATDTVVPSVSAGENSMPSASTDDRRGPLEEAADSSEIRAAGHTVRVLPKEQAGTVGMELFVVNGGKERTLVGGSRISDDCLAPVSSIDELDGWGGGELLIVVASVSCEFEGVATRRSTAVSVFVIDLVDSALSVREVFHGKERVRWNDGLEYEAKLLQFYVEGEELAVYAHTVAWCDRDALLEAVGAADCHSEERRLELLSRVPIWR